MASVQDHYDRLRSLVEYPEAWKPEPGETLVGEALRWETVPTKASGAGTPAEQWALLLRRLAA